MASCRQKNHSTENKILGMFETTWNAKDSMCWPNTMRDIRELMGLYGEYSSRRQQKSAICFEAQQGWAFKKQAMYYLIAVPYCSEIWKLGKLSDTSIANNGHKALTHVKLSCKLFQLKTIEVTTSSHPVMSFWHLSEDRDSFTYTPAEVGASS